MAGGAGAGEGCLPRPLFPTPALTARTAHTAPCLAHHNRHCCRRCRDCRRRRRGRRRPPAGAAAAPLAVGCQPSSCWDWRGGPATTVSAVAAPGGPLHPLCAPPPPTAARVVSPVFGRQLSTGRPPLLPSAGPCREKKQRRDHKPTSRRNSTLSTHGPCREKKSMGRQVHDAAKHDSTQIEPGDTSLTPPPQAQAASKGGGAAYASPTSQ